MAAIMLSRTGYTGEFGFEMFVRPADLESLWDKLLETGQAFGLTPCGLAARGSLRAGAVLPLSHQDIGAWPFIHHPWEFALPFNAARTGFTKSFVGHTALSSTAHGRYTYPYLGAHLSKEKSREGQQRSLHRRMMVEPTETESKENLDAFIAAMRAICGRSRRHAGEAARRAHGGQGPATG